MRLDGRPKSGQYAVVRISIAQSSKQNLVLFEIQHYLHQRFDIRSTIHTTKRPSANARFPLSTLFIGKIQSAIDFLELIRPHVIVKADKVKQALLHLRSRPFVSRPHPAELIDKAIASYDAGLSIDRVCELHAISWPSFRRHMKLRGRRFRTVSEAYHIKSDADKAKAIAHCARISKLGTAVRYGFK